MAVSMQANGSHEKIFSCDIHMESLRRFLEIYNTPKLLIRKKEIYNFLLCI
jgi:hypothetical protein